MSFRKLVIDEIIVRIAALVKIFPGIESSSLFSTALLDLIGAAGVDITGPLIRLLGDTEIPAGDTLDVKGSIRLYGGSVEDFPGGLVGVRTKITSADLTPAGAVLSYTFPWGSLPTPAPLPNSWGAVGGKVMAIRGYTEVITPFAAPGLSSMVWEVGTVGGGGDTDSLLTSGGNGLVADRYQGGSAFRGVLMDTMEPIPDDYLSTTFTADVNLDTLTAGEMDVYLFFLLRQTDLL